MRQIRASERRFRFSLPSAILFSRTPTLDACWENEEALFSQRMGVGVRIHDCLIPGRFINFFEKYESHGTNRGRVHDKGQ